MDCLATIQAPGGNSPAFDPGGIAGLERRFRATRDSSAIISWEVNRLGQNVPVASFEVDSGYDVTLAGSAYRLWLETERTAIGGDTVSLKVRGVIKNSAGNQVANTPWVTRTHTWNTCEDA
jgi:hypothetical protein